MRDARQRRGEGPHHVYLVPGFFGFANLGEVRYFGHVHDFLAELWRRGGLEARLHVVHTHPTSSLRVRARLLLETVARTAGADGGPIHLIGHSSGGLDARLFATPDAALGGSRPLGPLAARLRTVVTVSAPHHGTPLASFLSSLLGQRLLRTLSLATIYVLRRGHLPLSVVLRLGAVFARLDKRVVGTALLDQLFSQLLADFSAARRREIKAFLGRVGEDQALLLQLTPEAMDVFNAVVRDRPGVRYGSVATRARAPGLASALAAGLDPSAHATHAVYVALSRLAGKALPPGLDAPTPAQARALRRAYGALEAGANDGVVPTRSQVWGEVIAAAYADHLDVLGHFGDAAREPPHYDWLTTGSGFDRAAFERVWTRVARFVAGAAGALAPAPAALRDRRAGAAR